MIKRPSIRLAAILLATTVIVAPEMATAQGRYNAPAYQGYQGSGAYDYQGRNWNGRRGYRDSHNDAVAAGVVGLALGVLRERPCRRRRSSALSVREWGALCGKRRQRLLVQL